MRLTVSPRRRKILVNKNPLTILAFMLTKKQVLSAIKNMPDTFDTIQLFDRILLINKVEEGRLQLKAGKGLSTEEAKKKLK